MAKMQFVLVATRFTVIGRNAYALPKIQSLLSCILSYLCDRKSELKNATEMKPAKQVLLSR